MKKQLFFIAAISLFIVLGAFFICPRLSYAKNSVEVVGVNEDELHHMTMNQRVIPNKWNGKDRKIVYLTFDDGPSKRSLEFINILQQYEVPATFFYIGTNISRYEEVVKKVHENGYYIGLHTMSHDRTIIYNPANPTALIQELREEQELLESIIGIRPNLVRPPYGSVPGITPEMVELLVENNFKIWDWTIDSKDWKQKSASAIIETIKKQANHPIEMVLLHEKELSLEALPAIIEFFKAEGYEFRMYETNQQGVFNFLKDNRL